MKYKTFKTTMKRNKVVYKVKINGYDTPWNTGRVLGEDPNLGKQAAKAAAQRKIPVVVARRIAITREYVVFLTTWG